MSASIDPLAWAEKIGRVVSSGEKRKYYRFCPASFYGGIATADCVGCCLKCLFCWSWQIIPVSPTPPQMPWHIELVYQHIVGDFLFGQNGAIRSTAAWKSVQENRCHQQGKLDTLFPPLVPLSHKNLNPF